MRAYFLETPRLSFSHWTPEDADLARLLWGDESVTRYIAPNGRFSEAEIDARLRLEIANERQFGIQYWPIFAKETDEFVGCCGLRPHDIEKKSYELGFHLRSAFWGKGLGPEAAKAVMRYAFDRLGAQAFFAGHHPDNVSSRKVLERLGFTPIGSIYYTPTGLYHPSYRCEKMPLQK